MSPRRKNGNPRERHPFSKPLTGGAQKKARDSAPLPPSPRRPKRQIGGLSPTRRGRGATPHPPGGEQASPPQLGLSSGGHPRVEGVQPLPEEPFFPENPRVHGGEHNYFSRYLSPRQGTAQERWRGYVSLFYI
ncbi:hypothetical protein CRENBAI_017069 [Crenichthys baileyi]|uniref:Uncharacterized protein n=1 Tax=Crenichthys baileyi TaxID=28760 RepID=A0AAV9RA80_9TELE